MSNILITELEHQGPGDILGAISGETDVDPGLIGNIDIEGSRALVEVGDGQAEELASQLHRRKVEIMAGREGEMIYRRIVEYTGLVELGPKGYAKTIFAIPEDLHPVMKGVMAVIMPPVELLGKLTKPFALAVRLFANMTAGHFVLLSLLGLIITYGGFTAGPSLVAVVGPLLLGLFVMFLEIFVAFLQAYIFAILTAVFIGLIRAH